MTDVSGNPSVSLPEHPELKGGVAFPLAVGGRVYLDPNRIEGSTFTVTQGDITNSMTNHISKEHTVTLVLVLDRRIEE